jgi:hypothetical protein
MRAKEFMAEMFSDSSVVEWQKKTEDNWHGEFQTPSGRWFQIWFARIAEPDAWMVEFSEIPLDQLFLSGRISREDALNGPRGKTMVGTRNPTGRGEAFAVYGTVFSTIKMFVGDVKPESLNFKGATEKQTQLYLKIIKRDFSTYQALGYSLKGAKLKKTTNIVENARSPAAELMAKLGHGDDHVSLDLTMAGPSIVVIDQIWSEHERGAGHGSRWMRKIVEVADRLGVTLKLIANPLHYDLINGDYDDDSRGYDHLADLNTKALDEPSLKAWYERFGFVFDADHESDAVRLPRIREFMNIVENAQESTISAVLHKARELGFHGWGGDCFQAAIAINRVLFNGQGKYIGDFNAAFLDHGEYVGHLAVGFDGALWDADGIPKGADDLDGWGSVEGDDATYIEYAVNKLGIEWNEQTASISEAVEFDNEAEVISVFGDHNLPKMVAILERAKAVVVGK